MSRRARRLAATLAMATAAVVVTAAPAVAGPAVPPVCRDVWIGAERYLHLCLGIDAGHDGGTTFTPVLLWECGFHPIIGEFSCNPWSPGTYGWTTGGPLADPEVDLATGSVKHPGGYVGTIHAGAETRDVTFESFCVGDPAFCGS